MKLCAYFTENRALIGRIEASEEKLMEFCIIPIEKITKGDYKKNVIKFYEKNIKYNNKDAPINFDKFILPFYVEYTPRKKINDLIQKVRR